MLTLKDFPDEIVEWMVRNETYKATKAYLDRGRRYRARDADAMAARWVVLVRAWLEGDGRDERERHDIEAEMGLRRLALPFDEVKDEVLAFKRRLDADLDAATPGPAATARIEEFFHGLVDEYEADLRAVRS